MREAKVRASHEVSLYSGASVSAAWQNVILPWFKKVSPRTWHTEKPSAVLVPSRSFAHFLRGLLLQNDLSLLGLHFLTPVFLREMLLRGSGVELPAREHLHLLLSIAAEHDLDDSSPAASTAKSVIRAPAHLLRAFENVAAASSNFSDVGSANMRAITSRFAKLVQQTGFDFIHDADRAAAGRASNAPPVFHDLLMTGFDGAHWPLWFLLQAAANAATHATIVLTDPRDEARDLDEAWIGTWEEIYGAATPIENSATQSETLFPELFERERPTDLPPQIHFLVGRNVTEQAEAVVALITHFLGSNSAERIGVLFPCPGALPRIVASRLVDAGIPHNDGIAHLAPGPLEDDAWLELQENPRLRILLRFLRALPDVARLFGGLRVERIEKILRNVYEDLLIDDLSLFREFCATGSDDERKVAAGLTALQFLPECATFPEYLTKTYEIFSRLNWTERRIGVERATAAWCDRVPDAFSRAIYLRWLSEISASFLPARSDLGDHPYSRVQLLLSRHAEGQQWSHLIFAGLNEGSWPPRSEESGFLSDEEIDKLNARIPKLNRSALRQGGQGEGHSVVAEGKTFCLGPGERRQLAMRQFRNLIESATDGIAITANLIEESAPERLANPSEFFAQLYYEVQGEALSQTAMSALQNRTQTWLQKEFPREEQRSSTETQQTNVAYKSRRAPNQLFSEYEFALREPLTSAVQFSVSAWERAIKAPALVWMEKFLGVSATEDEFVNWNLATGQWVHRWLRQIANPDSESSFIARPGATAIRERASAAAVRFRDEVATLLARFDRSLPDWWLSGWKYAVSVADCLTSIVALTEDWSHFATEWTLPQHSIQFGDNHSLSIKGRIDLLLARGQTPNGSLPFSDVWVVDYKTGTKKSLAPKRSSESSAEEQLNVRLRKGHGVQLALYALALRELGAVEIVVSLLTRDVELDRPQIGIKEIVAQDEIWRELARMAATGVFGMRGPVRAEFAFQNPYPLATIPIDLDLLEEKWSRTHPALTRPEADE